MHKIVQRLLKVVELIGLGAFGTLNRRSLCFITPQDRYSPQ